MTLDNILEEIKKAKKIVILTHEMPDGDAVGSSLAMKHAIKSLGKDADVIIPQYSNCFNFCSSPDLPSRRNRIDSVEFWKIFPCSLSAVLWAENDISKPILNFFEPEKGDFELIRF